MSRPIAHDGCVRKRVEIFGENYYITVGHDFVIPTIPRENDPTMNKERRVVETLCEVISSTLAELHKGEDCDLD